MPHCKDVARLVASEGFEEARRSLRLAVRVHLAMCRDCRRYGEQLRALGTATRGLMSVVPSEIEMARLKRLEQAIRNERT
jgi:hypothetical protein